MKGNHLVTAFNRSEADHLQKWEDVSDVEGVRWITGHIGVRDSGVIYYPDYVETIR